MNEKYYLINELTNTQGQDGSSIAVFGNLDSAVVSYHQTLAAYHNAQDVLRANVMVHDQYGRVVGGYSETVDHTPEPEPNTEG